MKPFRFADFRAEAEDLVAAARARAEEIVAGARAEADRVREAAREEGRAEGRAAAAREERVRLAEETSRAVEAVVRLVREVEERRDALVREAERDLLRLAVAVAGKVVKREVRLGPGVAAANVAAAAAQAGRRQGLVARVHPDDAKRIELPRIGPVALQADPTVEPGGCVLELSPGEVDLRIGTQLEEIERELLA